VLGVVYNPVTGHLYHGIAGRGSFRNNQRIRALAFDRKRVTLVASVGEIARGLLDNLDPAWIVQELGSTALKMMRVAEGGADLYVSRSPKGIWDLAAAAVIVHAAGASVRSLDGRLLDFDALDSLAGLIVIGRGGEGEVARLVRAFSPAAVNPDNEDRA
jgi:3'-phosphoadenosine 5'-phosphosulfate (PAPS) 3'-phosphatase